MGLVYTTDHSLQKSSKKSGYETTQLLHLIVSHLQISRVPWRCDHLCSCPALACENDERGQGGKHHRENEKRWKLPKPTKNTGNILKTAPPPTKTMVPWRSNCLISPGTWLRLGWFRVWDSVLSNKKQLLTLSNQQVKVAVGSSCGHLFLTGWENKT